MTIVRRFDDNIIRIAFKLCRDKSYAERETVIGDE